MRREWAPWIKNRRWDEFEREAKTEPSAQLADTVAELIKGFPEKTDRKALKKVLFLLHQAGYDPQDVEESEMPPTPLAEPEAPYAKGYLSTADAFGDSVVAYAYRKGARVRWLIAHVGETRGFTEATESECLIEEVASREKMLLDTPPYPILATEVPAEYALYRLSRGIALSRHGMPQVIAYWRAVLREAKELPHPAASLPRQETTEEDRRMLSMSFTPAVHWRLELGSAAPVLERLSEAQMRDPDAPEAARREMADHILAQTRRESFTPELIQDYALRLLDLAYVLDLKRQSGSGLVLATHDDLVARGADSDFARGLLDKTLAVLVQTLRADGTAAPRMMRTTS